MEVVQKKEDDLNASSDGGIDQKEIQRAHMTTLSHCEQPSVSVPIPSPLRSNQFYDS